MPTHGALSKAGKVRAQTPFVERMNRSSSPIPRLGNRRRYVKLLINMQTPRWRRRRRR